MGIANDRRRTAMRSRKGDPWQTMALVAALAALVGAGVGAASALTWADRRRASDDRDLDALEARVDALERRSPPAP
jgi:hypothetical protein